MRLARSLAAWGSDGFREVLRQEVEAIGPTALPLQQALTVSSYVADAPITAMILGMTDDEHVITAKLGVFYAGINAGCNCADAPTPVEAQNEYCELIFSIDKTTADTSVRLAPD